VLRAETFRTVSTTASSMLVLTNILAAVAGVAAIASRTAEPTGRIFKKPCSAKQTSASTGASSRSARNVPTYRTVLSYRSRHTRTQKGPPARRGSCLCAPQTTHPRPSPPPSPGDRLDHTARLGEPSYDGESGWNPSGIAGCSTRFGSARRATAPPEDNRGI